MAKKKDDDQPQILIIKRIKKSAGGHHGGAWKVAYADFVTAMMAFFLLLWLLNVTTDEQKKMISSYFAPSDPRISESFSGSGGVMGGTTIAPEGAMTSDKQPTVAMQKDPAEGIGRADGDPQDEKKQISEQLLQEELERRDQKTFTETEEKIKAAIESSPDLKDLAQNLMMDMTPEGLRIQIIDQEGKPMFELGSANPLPQTVKLLEMITKVIMDLPNKISIRGHTDSKPYGKGAAYTNWELSADRSNASRRVMLAADLDIARIENVQGKADREPLLEHDPENASNRRISIILMKQNLTRKPGDSSATKKKPEKPQPKKQEKGVIYFP